MRDTITESELTAITAKHYNSSPKSLDDIVRLIVSEVGITVVPDPIPEPEGDFIVVDRHGDAWKRDGHSWSIKGEFFLSWNRVIEEFGPVKIYRAEGDEK